MIIRSNLSKMKNKTLPTFLQGNYRESSGEFSNTSHGVFGAERVNVPCFLISTVLVSAPSETFFITPPHYKTPCS